MNGKFLKVKQLNVGGEKLNQMTNEMGPSQAMLGILIIVAVSLSLSPSLPRRNQRFLLHPIGKAFHYGTVGSQHQC
ncbi:unnamed protein product, partial [Vitis vinifera]